ncbi:MAG: hypothetical protein Q8S13_07150, partial [Dehalococcoidia bacterium]|nr:hypothetical protein [Dehalococcoidia bacterium]
RGPAGDPQKAGQAVDALLDSNEDLRSFFNILTRSGLVEPGAWRTSGAPTAGLVGGEIGFDLNYLKQIRDAFDLDRALYRAIVETRSLYDDVTDFRFLEESGVVVKFMHTVTMAEFLEDILGAAAPTEPDAPGAAQAQGAGPSRNRTYRRWGQYKGAEASTKTITVPAALAFTFKSDIQFDVLGTVYTYGPKHPPAPATRPTG